MRLCIVLSFFLIWTAGYSQFLEGTVVDENTGDPLSFATVAAYSSADSSFSAGTIADISGGFQLQGVPSSAHYLEISFLGYNKKIISEIQLKEGNSIQLGTIFLKPSQSLLDEITVTGEQLTVVSKVDRQVFDSKRFLSGTGGTATDLLKNLPGISVNANGEISLRGTTGFVLMINGKPIQTDAAVLLNQLAANSIESIEVLTAPSAKYDPEGKAGIINLITAKKLEEGVFLQLNTRGGLPSIEDYDNASKARRYGADFTINYRKKKWDISIGANYLRNDISGRRVGEVSTIVGDTLTEFPSDGERSFDERNNSGRLTLGFSPTKSSNLSLGLYGGRRSKDRTADILYLENRGSLRGAELYSFQYFNENLRIRKGDFALGSIDFTKDFADKSRLSASFLYEYTLLGGPTTNRNLAFPETNIVLQDEFNTNDNPLNGVRFQVDFASKPGQLGVWELGYQFRSLDHEGDFIYERRNNTTGIFELVPAFSSEVDLQRTIHSIYAQLTGTKNKFNYNIGLRLEQMDRTLDLKDKTGFLDTTYLYDFINPFPSASIQYDLSDDLALKAAYSRRIERTTTFKMNPFPEREHSETLEQGDPTLLPEFINLIEVGVLKDLKKASIFANLYFQDIGNVVNRVNTVFNDTILNRIYSNVGNARSAGFELGAEVKLTKSWKAFLGGNLYNYKIDGTFDNRRVETQSWIFSINANSSISLPGTWLLQGTFNYLSARNTAQGEDSRFYNPSLSIKKSFAKGRVNATLQWQNIDLGLLNSNEQRITTARAGEFFTTTNYVYEVDILMLNISYTLNSALNKSKFVKSEFGEKEF
ncbi:MAG: outer membrane beta-barrel family protein [Bacteroidota bacterium]